MSATKLFVVLAHCALLVVVAAQNECTAQQWGSTAGTPHELQRVYLQPPQLDWQLQVTSGRTCGVHGGWCQPRPVGVVVRVCDHFYPPNVSVLNNDNANIHRYSAVYGTATVDTTVYCASSCQNQYQYGVPSVVRALAD